jgi:hypothetical protein
VLLEKLYTSIHVGKVNLQNIIRVRPSKLSIFPTILRAEWGNFKLTLLSKH